MAGYVAYKFPHKQFLIQRELDPVLIYNLLSYASKYKLRPHFLICPFLQYHNHSDQSYYRLYLN